MARWLLIDGYNLAYRCFYATPALTRADGFPTNALHGWVKSLWRLIDQEKPAHTAVFSISAAHANASNFTLNTRPSGPRCLMTSRAKSPA